VVKRYHDGRLQAGRVNDPVLDARLVFDVLSNQLESLRQQQCASTRCHHRLPLPHYANGRRQSFDAVFTKSVVRDRLDMPQRERLYPTCWPAAPAEQRWTSSSWTWGAPARVADCIRAFVDPRSRRELCDATMGVQAVP